MFLGCGLEALDAPGHDFLANAVAGDDGDFERFGHFGVWVMDDMEMTDEIDQINERDCVHINGI